MRLRIDPKPKKQAKRGQAFAQRGAVSWRATLERFRAKWIPVRVKKTRQNKKIERGRDSIQS
jgi:hypothetical protein